MNHTNALKNQLKSAVKGAARRVPVLDLALERANFYRSVVRSPMHQRRRALAAQFLRGAGLEIGALHWPLELPRGARARYVDRMSREALWKEYPELRAHRLVKVDIETDGETLAGVPAASQDFVVANHLIEHCQNPLGALQTWLGVVRPSGQLFLAVPDKRFTFDRERPVTSLEHLWRDYENGPQDSVWEHYREWARLVAHAAPEAVEEVARELREHDYSIHFHVWTPETFLEMLLAARAAWDEIFTLEACARNENEFLVVLRKAGE